MKFKKGKIDKVKIFNLKKHEDERGYLVETYRVDTLPNKIKPEMSYVSFTNPQVSRGPHEHVHQTDIFTFMGPGNFMLKLWDNRKKSKTYLNFIEIYAGEDNPMTIIVPPGVVHGYKNVSKSKTKQSMVINYPDKLFMGWNKKEKVDEIRHEHNPDSPFKL